MGTMYRHFDAGGVCVYPTSAPICPVRPLAPLTSPDAIRFENGDRWRPDLLTLDYQKKLACIQNKISSLRGTYSTGSACRPTEYQSHLREIVTKDDRLDAAFMQKHPECLPIRKDVTQEMAKHSLRRRQAVAEPGASRHESGQAFDITPIGLTEKQIDDNAQSCWVTHDAVPAEPWHFQ